MAMGCDGPDAVPAVALFRSLGDPARLAIVSRLAEGEARVVDLTRLLGLAQFALAAYVSVEALRSLFGDDEPQRSTVGIILVAVSVVVMPLLSWAQRRAGRELGSASAVADSRQTLLCSYLSAAVLVGLLLNATLGWWWADPVVALGLAVVAVREGCEASRGQACCAPVRVDAGLEDECGCGAGVEL
jgi:predicted Co/Zn/Cd cation transporter (cation efflux family)